MPASSNLLATDPALPDPVFAVCPHALATVLPDGRITAVNPAWSNRFSGTPGTRWLDLVHPEDRGLAGIANPLHESRLRLRLSTPEGSWVVWHVALAPIRMAAEGVTFLVSALAPEVPIAVEDAVGSRDGRNLAVALSHDVGQHARLAGIYATLLSRSTLTTEAATQVAVIVDQTTRMQALLTRLVRWLRLADQPMEHQPCDLAALWRQAVVGLPVDIATGALPIISGDADQLVELFRELALNVVRYHRGSPRAALSAARTAEGWELALADDGPGIPVEHRERMLLPLHRRHTWEEVPGQGMGLALATRIAVRHGGGIRIGGGPDGGCTVYIRLSAH